jgi:hypothetical protein
MDISIWLRGLGLERYEQAFRENAIDEAILPKPSPYSPRCDRRVASGNLSRHDRTFS